MAVLVASDTTYSVAANTKTASIVSGEFEFIGRGNISLSALSSATGLRCSLRVGGITIIDDKPIPFFGTTGTLKVLDNNILSQAVAGGRVELYFRNTTAGALTVDYALLFEPTR